jgi:outer membrane receptor protein involved in Fe transport
VIEFNRRNASERRTFVKSLNQTTGRTGSRELKVALLASGACLLAVAFATPAAAQDKPAADAPASVTTESTTPTPTGRDEIVVTGSRIARKDYTSNSPLVTVSKEVLQNTSTAAIEQNLNKLPQFTPAKTPTGGFDIQPTATNTPGSATISLRGLGANRNLVLIDGHRATPGNAAMIVDINTIPSAAIDRVETITGGASATYGADAVAGVTNFIMKKNFRGAQLDGQMSVTQRGDGFEYQLGGIIGSDFAEGRGNVSIAMSINERKATYQSNREWYRDMWRDPNVGGNVFFILYPGVALNPANFPTNAAIQSVFPGSDQTGIFAPGKNTIAPAFGFIGYNVYTNPNGTPFTGYGFPFGRFQQGGLLPNSAGYGQLGMDGMTYKQDATGAGSANYTQGYDLLPLTRYNIYTRGNYDINDWIGIFGSALYSRVSTATQNQGGALTSGWDVYVPAGPGIYTGNAAMGIPSTLNSDGTTNAAYLKGGKYGLNCPVMGGCSNETVFPMPTALRTLLDSRPNPNGTVSLAYGFPDSRTVLTDVNTFNMTAGLQGKIPGTDWTWEAYVNHGESATYARQTGTYSLARTRALLQSPNFGYGFNYNSNTASDRNAFGANFATCTTGMNIFTTPWSQVSNDCKQAIRADLKNNSTIKQTIYEATAQGKLFDLPGGEVRAAVGADTSEVNYQFLNDTITTQGESFLDQTIGIYPSADSSGHIVTKELYGELDIPIVKDIPGIEELGLNVGARMSDYSTTGTSWTYKIMGDWAVTKWFRLRGGYNKAARAPNIAELYLSPQQTFAVNTIGDICSEQSNFKISANGGAAGNTATRAADIKAVCSVIMNNTGGAGTAAGYYARPPAQQPAPGLGFAFPTLVGNPNLTPEEAQTWTAGFVVSAPSSSPWLSGLRATFDWFNIKVNHAIGFAVADTLQTCLDPFYNPNVNGAATNAANAQAAAATAACKGVRYDPAPALGLGNVTMSYTNDGSIDISGIDAEINWVVPAGPGRFSIDMIGSYYLHYRVTDLSANAPYDYAGTFGTSSAGLDPGSYRYRLFTTFGYSIDKYRLAIQWQHLPSVEDSGEAVAHTTTLGAPSYDLFNLSVNANITSMVSLRGGIDNLLDKAPPYTGVNPANNQPAVNGNLSGGAFNVQFYDTTGRRFYIGATVKF